LCNTYHKHSMIINQIYFCILKKNTKSLIYHKIVKCKYLLINYHTHNNILKKILIHNFLKCFWILKQINKISNQYCQVIRMKEYTKYHQHKLLQ